MITLVDLCKRYGSRAALEGVTLEVRAGERVALVGPNGSGKSTLLRCLLGLLDFEGTVLVAGHDPLRDHVAAQRHVAYVPQRAPLLAAPVREVVSFWARVRGIPEDRLADALRSLGLELGAVAQRRFPELSGGMQQKLLAAAAIASSCPILLLDEPTANLDPGARRAFFDALASRSPSPTVILSSHRLEELEELVDRVVVLQDGRLVFDDRLERLLSDPSLRRLAGLDPAAGQVLPFRRSS